MPVLREQRARATLDAAETYGRVRREDTRAVDDRHDELRALEALPMQLEDQQQDNRVALAEQRGDRRRRAQPVDQVGDRSDRLLREPGEAVAPGPPAGLRQRPGCAKPTVLRLFQITKLDAAFDIFGDCVGAIAHVTEDA